MKPLNSSDPGSLEMQESADKTMNGQEGGLQAQSNASIKRQPYRPVGPNALQQVDDKGCSPRSPTMGTRGSELRLKDGQSIRSSQETSKPVHESIDEPSRDMENQRNGQDHPAHLNSVGEEQTSEGKEDAKFLNGNQKQDLHQAEATGGRKGKAAGASGGGAALPTDKAQL